MSLVTTSTDTVRGLLAGGLKGGKLSLGDPDSVPAGKYGKAALEKAFGHPVATYRNTEELYATAKDVDAVIISTADFQHAPALQ